MVIVKAPFRVSLNGGGSDFPDHFREHGGAVVGFAINHSAHVSARRLLPFHEYGARVVYRQVEEVTTIGEIKHPLLREVISRSGLNEVEVVYQGGLPSQTGTGSSSAFAVALAHALAVLNRRYCSTDELAREAIEVERTRLNEFGGWQDQYWAAFGGARIIRFLPSGDVVVEPLLVSLEEVESHVLLFHTRTTRRSHEVAEKYRGHMKGQFAAARLAEETAVAARASNWAEVGRLVDLGFRAKAELPGACPPEIGRLWDLGKLAGAFGGKLLGAGGGGVMAFVVPPEKRDKVIAAMVAEGTVRVPFRIEPLGSRVVYAELD